MNHKVLLIIGFGLFNLSFSYSQKICPSQDTRKCSSRFSKEYLSVHVGQSKPINFYGYLMENRSIGLQNVSVEYKENSHGKFPETIFVTGKKAGKVTLEFMELDQSGTLYSYHTATIDVLG
jgi:hypothetical protein